MTRSVRKGQSTGRRAGCGFGGRAEPDAVLSLGGVFSAPTPGREEAPHWVELVVAHTGRGDLEVAVGHGGHALGSVGELAVDALPGLLGRGGIGDGEEFGALHLAIDARVAEVAVATPGAAVWGPWPDWRLSESLVRLAGNGWCSIEACPPKRAPAALLAYVELKSVLVGCGLRRADFVEVVHPYG